jgi:hypothetical protein
MRRRLSDHTIALCAMAAAQSAAALPAFRKPIKPVNWTSNRKAKKAEALRKRKKRK